jgi:ligand-binding SRPBCC domain-containing protein
MKIYQLQKTQKLSISIEEAWDFFSDPKNLVKITPQWLNIKIVSDLPERMHEGMIVVYTVRPILNIPTTWVTEIKYVAEKYYFVDEQRFGPYKFWHHEHIFRKSKDGEVIMEDIVNYALPFGILGRIVNRYLVGKKIREIFNYRNAVLEEKFGIKKRMKWF